VIIPLDLTQLSCPGFTLSAGLVSLPASQLTELAVGGEPCGEPAISLHSHHVSLVLTQGTQVQISWGVLMLNWDSPVSVVSLQDHILRSIDWVAVRKGWGHAWVRLTVHTYCMCFSK
jgi:hypothetical protein